MIADATTFVTDAKTALVNEGVRHAVRCHDDAALFDWLIDVLSYQGVADAIAAAYMDENGRISWRDVAQGLARPNLCPKLSCYWQFVDCGYRKSTRTCSEPAKIRRCPVPRHRLRNGRLNQTAYSMFLFFRDVAEGDFVNWLDCRLAAADSSAASERAERLAAAVVEPMTHVHGVSHKVLNMGLSMLLLAGDPERERWQTAGAAMIAVDTLVHNWLHRTGILELLGSGHPYGPRCYAANGCANIIRRIALQIDARHFNPAFPSQFPRFVQYCLWWFCAQSEFDQCNGNRIDDRDRCSLDDCPLFSRCQRVALRAQQPAATPP